MYLQKSNTYCRSKRFFSFSKKILQTIFVLSHLNVFHNTKLYVHTCTQSFSPLLVCLKMISYSQVPPRTWILPRAVSPPPCRPPCSLGWRQSRPLGWPRRKPSRRCRGECARTGTEPRRGLENIVSKFLQSPVIKVHWFWKKKNIK